MSVKKYKCPYCEKRYERKELCDHVDRKHPDLLPENYTGTRLVFDKVNNNTKGYGVCKICGRPTKWNEKIGRYDQLCGRESCKKAIHERYRKNMIKVYGEEYSLLNDPEQQKKMLANRKISGEYRFQDGGKVGYTGSYEKKCLEFMDKVMEINSEDIMSPGPTMEYTYKGEKHLYIPDFLYIPYNLIIEVKDGGDKPNTQVSSSREDSKARTIAKEKIFTSDGEYNYIRLTNNEFVQLINIFMDMKYKQLSGDTRKSIHVNETYYYDNFNHNNKEPVFSVDVDLNNYGLLDEESINTEIYGLGKCKISVYGGEGNNEPHLHIRSDNQITVGGRKKNFDGCIKLYEPEFFAHGVHTDTFKDLKGNASKKAAKSFNNFMNSKDKKTGKQMWEICRNSWLENHEDVRNIAAMKNKPNYNKLV